MLSEHSLDSESNSVEGTMKGIWAISLIGAALAVLCPPINSADAAMIILGTSSTQMTAETSAGGGNDFDWERVEVNEFISGPGIINRDAGPVAASVVGPPAANSNSAVQFNADLGSVRIRTDGSVEVGGQGGLAIGLASSLNNIRFTTDSDATYTLTSDMSQSAGGTGEGSGEFVFGGAIRLKMLIGGNEGTIWERVLPTTPLVLDLGLASESIALTAGTYNLETLFRADGATEDTGSYSASQNYSVELVQVPEPSTIALLVTGAAGLLAWTWRRNRHLAD